VVKGPREDCTQLLWNREHDDRVGHSTASFDIIALSSNARTVQEATHAAIKDKNNDKYRPTTLGHTNTCKLPQSMPSL
jgi:hypothetical protein